MLEQRPGEAFHPRETILDNNPQQGSGEDFGAHLSGFARKGQPFVSQAVRDDLADRAKNGKRDDGGKERIFAGPQNIGTHDGTSGV